MAAGFGAYLYTSLEAVVLPIGPNARQVQALRRQGKSDQPGPRRKEMSASLVTTRRSTAEFRGALARIAQVAAQVVACYERFGPGRQWGFADPTGWKCSRRHCEAWDSCPGGAGL